MSWSSEQYLKFEDERTRPARDLLNAVPAADVRLAADLGCGPGNSTALIAARYPDAAIAGIDNSAAMIAAARTRLPKVRFELIGIEDWPEPGPWDLLFTNAALQWVPNHEHLLPRLAGRLALGGSLAIQMPDNLDEPSQTAMQQAAQKVRFAEKLCGAGQARVTLLDSRGYYALLKPFCRRVDVWKTTYYHPLAGGVAAIVDWFKGTGLIPFLKPLLPDEQAIYLQTYREELDRHYKPLTDGTVILPFPRLFIVATR